jgi:hypothetical protein
MKRLLLDVLGVGAGVILLLIGLEVVLRFMPVAWAPAVQPPTATDPIQRYVANAPFTWSLGWNFYHVVHGRTNAQGFVADYDYSTSVSKPTLAVIGDSFVEALMVPFAESLTGRLQAMLGDRAQAIAIAQAGSPFSQYVAYAAHACAAYRPQRMVVPAISNDFDESVYANRVREGIHHLHPRAGGGFELKLTPARPLRWYEQIARRSALALYLIRNLEAQRLIASFGVGAARAGAAPAGNGAAAAARLDEGRKVAEWFLHALPRAACLPPSAIVLVVDALRPQLYDDAQLEGARATYFGRLRAELMARARAQGFVVIDAEDVMRADYRVNRQPFEFETDMHWNAHAHAVIAAAVKKALGDWP